ncbi:SpaA isopeptide-forming pilin-related protein [Microbacterium sp. NPDC058342]|uniref:prealbumin-like fold domain-containing protein n=1 Tax=Microbacterium sp. NPDC058342 TaxID=3346454 RepID=UPI00365C1AE0
MRAGQTVVVGLISGALMFAGASVALGEDSPPADQPAVSDQQTDGTPDAGADSPAQPEPVKQLDATEQPEQTPPSSEPQQPAQGQLGESEGKPQQTPQKPGRNEQTSQHQQQKAAQPEQMPDSDPQQKTPSSAPSPAAAAALRWEMVDRDGDLVAGAIVTLQGARDETIADQGDDEQWADAAETAVEDNTGQSDYSGVDLDPTPGAFQVEQFADEDDPKAVATAVQPDADYRVRTAQATGYTVGDATEWTVLAASTETTHETTDVELIPLAAQSKAAAALPDAVISPLAAGPEAGATKPYLYWEVRDQSNALRGGATFQVQGPRTSSYFWLWGEYDVSWNGAATVTDCTSAPCTGLVDQDPDPGEFLVIEIGSHRVSDSNRYRVRQQTAPTGYFFTAPGNAWAEIPGTRDTPSGWSNQVYTFSPFKVTKASSLIQCTPGYIYQISGNGSVGQIAPSGAITNVIPAAAGVSNPDFNGLGIGYGGSPVYAYDRSTSETASIYKVNAQGRWEYTGDFYDTDLGNSLVAGAVNLSTGKYVFGGFTDDGSRFKLWQYNPGSSSTFQYLGYIETNSSSSGQNGDIAFDNSGNLFIVRGSGTSTTVYSVQPEDLASPAPNGRITSSPSADKTTMTSVNGVAFDANGKAFLGAGSEMRRYAMPNWAYESAPTSSMSDSKDLASCGSPATITLRKNVQGRNAASDQFKLTLKQGATELGTATTTGTVNGIQPQQVGPQATVRNVTLSFTEAAAGTTDLSKYATSYVCTVDGEPLGTSGSGTTGTVTIPASGDSIVCTFTNAPLVTDVTVSKRVQDSESGNPQPGVGWTVGAAVSGAQNGTVTPSGTLTKSTGQNGSAAWKLQYSKANTTADIVISETQQSGYQFVEGTCAVTRSDGSTTVVALADEAGSKLEDVPAGSSVNCEIVNKQTRPTLTLVKVVDSPAAGTGYAGPEVWTLTATGSGKAQGTVVTGTSSTPAVTSQTVPAGTYALTEQFSGTPSSGDGYRWTSVVCLDGNQNEVARGTVQDGVVTAASVTLAAGLDVTCTYTNTPKPGAVTWVKVDQDASTTLLAGSVWKLAGPGLAPGGATVEDCLETNSADCTGLDKDPAAGGFRIEGLLWGDYTLTETSAPLGYVLDAAPHLFTISGAALTAELAPITNAAGTPPTLPLTGGLSSDFYSLLGLGVLLLAFALLMVRRVWLRRRAASALGGAMTD